MAWSGKAAGKAMVAASLMASVVAIGAAGAQTQADTGSRAFAPRPCAVAAPIAGEVAKLPAGAALEDYEGAILFAVGQLDCDRVALIDALTALMGDGSLPAIERKAIANVIAELRRRGRGTGSVYGGAGMGFGAPLIGVGGGSSNYTRP